VIYLFFLTNLCEKSVRMIIVCNFLVGWNWSREIGGKIGILLSDSKAFSADN